MERKSFMPTRVQQQFADKLQAQMAKDGLDVLFLTTPEAIFYATGYYAWCYHGRPCGHTIAVVPAAGRVSILCSQFEQGGAELQTKGDVDVVAYPVAMHIEDYYDEAEKDKVCQPDPNRTFRMAVEIAKRDKGEPVVGIERGSLPVDRFFYLAEQFGQDNLRDLAAFFTAVRMIKFPWEVDVLRYSAQVAEEMMNITMKGTEPGMTEADIFRIWNKSAWDVTGGHELCHINQVHTPGPDFWATMMPRETVLKDGDVVRLDGGVTIYGYVSDLGRSHAVGKTVSPKQQALFDTLLAGYDTLVTMLKPGVRMCDAFRATMEVCQKGELPHFIRGHFGHSISLGPSPDFPMIAPSNEMTFAPGMVFSFELPYYSSEFGSFNIEDTCVITEDGHELFTNTNRSLFVK